MIVSIIPLEQHFWQRLCISFSIVCLRVYKANCTQELSGLAFIRHLYKETFKFSEFNHFMIRRK